MQDPDPYEMLRMLHPGHSTEWYEGFSLRLAHYAKHNGNMTDAPDLPDEIGDDLDPALDEYSDRYGRVCDVIERTYHGWPLDRTADEAPVLHTSKEARAA